MNFAQGLGVFLSFYADREETKTVAFPGNAASYSAHYTEVGQKTLARAHIFASNLSETQNGEIFNVGDSPLTTGSNWAEKWPAICDYFGLVGVGPEDDDRDKFSVTNYMQQHKSEWEEYEKKHELKSGIVQSTGFEFLEVLITLGMFDRHYDLSKISHAGFQEREDTLGNYLDTFALMKRAKMIP
jgi:hypothetical protein